jgi:hypothetical protein
MRHRRALSGLPLLAALLFAACNDTNGLLPAQIVNVVDTISLYALDGTPITAPSGYVVQSKTVVRTDQSPAGFDFAFNITPAGQAVLLPTGAMHLVRGSGIQADSVAFDAITTAPTNAYIDTLPVSIDSGSVVVVHSRPIGSCTVGIVFFYGKFEVLAIDTLARRVDLRTLVDQNCGYRGLEPGLPSR